MIIINFGEVKIRRSYDTEVRLCNCYNQSCKGRFLIKVGSPFLVCPDEAFRLKLITNIKQYYK